MFWSLELGAFDIVWDFVLRISDFRSPALVLSRQTKKDLTSLQSLLVA